MWIMCCTKEERKSSYTIHFLLLMKWCHYGLNDVKEVRNSVFFSVMFLWTIASYKRIYFMRVFPAVSWYGRCHELSQWRRLCGQELLYLNNSSLIIITGLSWSLRSGCPTHRKLFASTTIAILPELYRVIHKSLRDFRNRLRNNQDRHGRKEHINR